MIKYGYLLYNFTVNGFFSAFDTETRITKIFNFRLLFLLSKQEFLSQTDVSSNTGGQKCNNSVPLHFLFK